MKMQVRIDNQLFNVEIEDIHSRPVVAKVDGELFEVWPEEIEQISTKLEPLQGEQVIPSPSVAKISKSRQNTKDIHAPLPGVIISIDVKVGDTVKQGQTLCTLEAMKMKNAIRSTREGAISEIHINTGDQVSHGQLLISFAA